MTRGEILHVGIGGDACRLTAHWSNLQGLAASSGAHCAAEVTHTEYQQLLVPRVLLIDASSESPELVLDEDPKVTIWRGSVQRLDRRVLSDQFQPSDSTVLPPVDPFAAFFQTASTLAAAPLSRYRAPTSSKVNYQTAANGRHVNWDDDDEEEPDEEEVQARADRQEREWAATQQAVQAELDQFWDVTSSPQATSWHRWFMPPYHPRSIVTLGTQVVRGWDVDSPQHLQAACEDVLERLRWVMEECDSLAGLVLATSSFGWESHLSSAVLGFLADESAATRRLTLAMEPSTTSETEETWRTRKITDMRGNLRRGLTLHSHVEGSTLFLPLQVASDHTASMAAAAALETVTLPYRFLNVASEERAIALNTYYFGDYNASSNFGSAPSLSFSEFLTALKPSAKHSMLELDALAPSPAVDLDQALLSGTSIERDARMQNRQVVATELPGTWMLEQEAGGILSPLSPLAKSRALHEHFAITSGLRPSSTRLVVRQLSSCLMEGMGVRYRPEQSTSCVVQESLAQLVRNGYAAGSYWKSMYGLAPVLTTLSNSTRSFQHLQTTTASMKESLAPKSRGFYNRDISNGLLPEMEDCVEALSFCLDLRDVYRPPDSSGMADEEEGDYF